MIAPGRNAITRVLLFTAMAATVALVIVLTLLWNQLRTENPATISLVPGMASSSNEPLPAEFSFATLNQPRPLPELRFIDGNGRAMNFADFRGRVVLLNLWATWCVPCRKEMPTLDRLQAKLGGPDFQVVALSIDRQGLSVVKPFYKELGLKALGIYVDQSGKAASDLGAVGIPTTLLVDRKGRELGRKAGPAEWDSPATIDMIRRYLKPPAGAGQQPTDGGPAK